MKIKSEESCLIFDPDYVIFDNSIKYKTEDVIDSFYKATIKDDCKGLKREDYYNGIKYVAKFKSMNDQSIFFTEGVLNNEKIMRYINIMDKVVEQRRNKNIRKLKVSAARSALVVLGSCALFKGAGYVYNRINDPVKDIEVTYDVDDDYEAINKMKKVHEEAMEQRYNDYVKEEKEAKDEALRQRELMEESNQKYEQQMIENAHLYQDISNMSNVEIIGNDNQNDVKTLKK